VQTKLNSGTYTGHNVSWKIGIGRPSRIVGQKHKNYYTENLKIPVLRIMETNCLLNYKLTRIWANDQRDGRPIEYRWCPVLNAAVWLSPTAQFLLECCAVMLPIGQCKTWRTQWILQLAKFHNGATVAKNVYIVYSPGNGQTLCKVWLASLERCRCSNEAKMRKPLKLAGMPQTTRLISAASGPKFTILWGHVEVILLLNKSFSNC